MENKALDIAKEALRYEIIGPDGPIEPPTQFHKDYKTLAEAVVRLENANKHLQISLDKIESAERHHHGLLWQILCAQSDPNRLGEWLRITQKYFDECEHGTK